MIRTLTEADLPELEANFPEPSPGAHKKRLIKQQKGWYLYSAAIIDDTIAAIELIRWQHLKIPAKYQDQYPYPEIGSLFVLPAYRHHGLATALLTYSEAKIRERGHKGSVLMIQDDNEPSIHLHRTHGYRPVGPAEPNKAAPFTERTVYVKQF
jgi:GNAT superfamily N-acetyltransferase